MYPELIAGGKPYENRIGIQIALTYSLTHSLTFTRIIVKPHKSIPQNFSYYSILLIIAAFSIFLSSCASTDVKEVKKTPTFDECGRKIILSKGIATNITAAPIEPAANFSADDREVVASLKCMNLSGEHHLRWEWYDPNGKLYLSSGNSPFNAPTGRYFREASAWHKLSIQGNKPSDNPGNWKVKVYFDSAFLTSQDFVIEMGIDVDRPFKIAQKPNPANWGLIIGIETYANLPSVDYAKRDAITMKEYFIKILGVPEENIISLLDTKATKSQIEGILKSYLPRLVGRDTNFYVYFSGHGFPDLEKGKAHLVPYDGDTRFVIQTGYKLEDFYGDIGKLNINRAYVFLDSCFSGGTREGKMLMAGVRPGLIYVEETSLASDKVIALSASSGGQISSSYPEGKHGLFTYFLLDALRGKADTNRDGLINMGELYGFVKDMVTMTARRKGQEQTPVVTPSLDAVRAIKDFNISNVIK